MGERVQHGEAETVREGDHWERKREAKPVNAGDPRKTIEGPVDGGLLDSRTRGRSGKQRRDSMGLPVGDFR